MTHPLAGQLARHEHLTDIRALLAAYFNAPDASQPGQRVSFGTSGHRGNAFAGSFNEAHIVAIVQAVIDYRREHGIGGPLMLGKDTHALSTPAELTALSVLAAQNVTTWIQTDAGYTPTPVLSRALIRHNQQHPDCLADGLLLTPSHNPPEDGGIKYNPPGGGPADTNVTQWIEGRANALLAADNAGVPRLPAAAARESACIRQVDFATDYIEALGEVIDMAAIARAGLQIGVDPLGGAAIAYWPRIARHYGLSLKVVNTAVDAQFAFMPLDHDGKIRMDCSSPHAMANLVALKDGFAIAWGNDADVDRHGIVTPTHGLLNPNHFLCVAIHYLLTHRPQWPATAKIGKTLVSSALIDVVVGALGRTLYEVPVGFKWFADGLLQGDIAFGGEESAGASFLQRDGSVWTTDKDGIVLGLLAAEITAVTGKNPGEYYADLTARHGQAYYRRIDSPMSEEQRRCFKTLKPEQLSATTLAGQPITAVLTQAPGNGAGIGGIKVVSEAGWFAARPSGTEAIYKLYAESLKSGEHLEQIIADAERMISAALQG
jgi:phosphoglucomutase